MLLILICVFVTLCWLLRRRQRGRNEFDIGFLHPASGGGGGGERVLWMAIRALQKSSPSKRIVLFTKSYGGISPTEQKNILLSRVKDQFSISVDSNLTIRFLSEARVGYLDPKFYPSFTLFRQSIWGGFGMFVELCGSTPPILVDTVGIPFVYPPLSLFCGTVIVPYVHYPVISTDMIDRVEKNVQCVNNTKHIAASPNKTRAKILYYRFFSWLYWFCGQFASNPMVNSSWTAGHISRTWSCKPRIIFPPCNVSPLKERGMRVGDVRSNTILSVGQFRPEKDHALQLRSFKLAVAELPNDVILVLAGGVRGSEDLERVESLKLLAKNLGIDTRVQFLISRPHAEIVQLLCEATIGLHTMADEHFGIVVVEYQAAGALVLAHDSAGPKMDIVVNQNMGRLATSEEDFAKNMVQLFRLNKAERMKMRDQAWSNTDRFTDERFEADFIRHLQHFGV